MQVDILDHGYVKFIEHWGSDESIIEAARMSTNKGFQGWGPKKVFKDDPSKEASEFTAPELVKEVPGDEKLLAFLWNNKHATPFEMAGMVIEVQAPIFVFREWHRHRTQSYNELSARYTPLPDVNYVPTVERLMLGSDGKNKQAGTVQDAIPLTEENAQVYQIALKLQYKNAQDLYEKALISGVPKEVARIHLPVGRYSRMRASANLRNWLAFLTLRMDSKAQWEIRQYADVVGSMVKEKFPRTWELFFANGA